MYAAAGGASLASRQARRKQKVNHTSETMQMQFHKRFQQLQHQHAPACAEGYHYMRTSSSGFLSPSHLPSFSDLHGRGNTIDFSLQEQLLEGKTPSVWLEKEKKGGFSPCSELEPSLIGQGKLKIAETQRKWSKKNKLYESSFGDSSLDDLRGGLHRQYDAAANMLLYIGLCAVALGLVIAFVGTGEKGFKTVQLRLIGPTMIGCGSFCCALRIFFCFCPTRCMRKRFKHRHKNHPGLAGAIPLREHRLMADPKTRLEFYKHLPFQGHVDRNFLLYDNMRQQQQQQQRRPPQQLLFAGAQPNATAAKKRVSIKNENHIIDDAASDSLSTLRELSPLREEDLIDFQRSSNSFENLPSLDSSLEYLHEQTRDDAALCGGVNNDARSMFTTEEQLQRLRSTLTFRDSTDLQLADSRLTMSCDDFDLQEELKFERDDADGAQQERKDEESAAMLSQELVLSAGMLEKN